MTLLDTGWLTFLSIQLRAFNTQSSPKFLAMLGPEKCLLLVTIVVIHLPRTMAAISDRPLFDV